MLLPVEGDEVHGWKPGQPVAFVAGAANEQGPAFSPDGKWLAYYSNSNPSGRNDAMRSRFQAPGRR